MYLNMFISLINDIDLRSIVPWDELDAFRQRGLNPQHPMMRGLGQDPQVYYQSAVSANQCGF